MKNKFIKLGTIWLISLVFCSMSFARTIDEEGNHHGYSTILDEDMGIFFESSVYPDTICPVQVKFDSIIVTRCASDTTYKIDGKVQRSGIYSFVFKLPNGCDSIFKIYFDKEDPYVSVFSHPIQPDIGFGTGRIRVETERIFYLNFRTYTYKWSNGSESPTLINLKAGQYTVTVTDNIGCSTIKDFIVPLVKPFDIPNAFTPNNDGVNDDFAPILHLKPKGMVFKIYNRMGHLVYNHETPDTGWDGTYKGQEAASDVYVYWLELDYGEGHIVRGSGEVTLIR
jgi:gliding motility-associated-like protein